jgi:hypothetical protein
METMDHLAPNHKRIGDYNIGFLPLKNHKEILKNFSSADFKNKPYHVKLHEVFKALSDEILKGDFDFYFPKVIFFFNDLISQNILPNIKFYHFELWINQFSELEKKQEMELRAKLVGKKIPRDAYQIYFPIGQNKTFSGPHFITAHASPDLDTSVASFWGFLDAFGAKVSEGLHLWNVPKDAPSHQVEFKMIFDDLFSKSLIDVATKNFNSLEVSALELVSQKNIAKKDWQESSLSIDVEKSNQAVVIVDEKGYFEGDWRSQDIEGVRQVVMLVNQMLRHFQNRFQKKLITLFSKENLKADELFDFINHALSTPVWIQDDLIDVTDRQRKHVQDYLVEILKVTKGLDASFIDLANGLEKNHVKEMQNFIQIAQSEKIKALFNKEGLLDKKASFLFLTLDEVIEALDKAIQKTRAFVDQLKVTLEIKSKVFNLTPLVVSEKSQVEELRAKMGNNAYLTVCRQEDHKGYPLGVLYAQDLFKPTLGTVTLRDFSNREETKIPAYLEVISLIDHHKVHIANSIPSTMYISDAQSSNVTLAQLAFAINDRYSTQGMDKKAIESQLNQLKDQLTNNVNRRLYRRLLQKLEVLDQRGDFKVSKERELTEYMHFLFAILDDTDLLSKVTKMDVECVKDLLNRMKTILVDEEVEVLHFDDLSEGPDFVQNAVSRLLRNADLFSITQKVYLQKKVFINELMKQASLKENTLFFADTKEQNGCARIGQFKLYSSNYQDYQKYEKDLKKAFIDESDKVFDRKKEIDLHIFMLSTVQGLEEKNDDDTAHFDELWFYLPKDAPYGHMRSFLHGFSQAPHTLKSVKEILYAAQDEELAEDILASTLETSLKLKAKKVKSDAKGLFITLKVQKGSMNSRKSAISPYLPKI